MALITSAQSGNFNQTSTWSGGVVPTSVDEARVSNGHIIHITQSVKVIELSNSGTGVYYINDGVTLEANVINRSATASTRCLELSANSPASATIVGILSGGTGLHGRGVSVTGTGTLTVVGRVVGGSGGGRSVAIEQNSAGNIFITGNVDGGTGASVGSFTDSGHGVFNSRTGNIFITGNVTGNIGSGSNAVGAFNASSGNIFITGNVSGGSAINNYGMSAPGAGFITIVGNVTPGVAMGINGTAGQIKVTGDVVGLNGINGINNSTGGPVIVSGNILNAANGTPAIYAQIIRIDPIPQNSYIRYARNGTGGGADAWFFQFTADTFSTFSVPTVSSVRLGTSYAANTLVGTCHMPSPSAVAFGTPYDSNGSRTGLAFNNSNVVFNTLIQNLSVTNSIGDRLKKSATVESTGHLVASFSN